MMGFNIGLGHKRVTFEKKWFRMRFDGVSMSRCSSIYILYIYIHICCFFEHERHVPIQSAALRLGVTHVMITIEPLRFPIGLGQNTCQNNPKYISFL